MSLKISGDGLKDIQRGLDFLKHKQLLVGVTEQSASRGQKINNAELAFIHSNGSPVRNIPARPFLEPGIEKNKGELAELLKIAVVAAIDGDEGGANASLEQAGEFASTAVRKYIANGNFAPLSPLTIARKGSSKPLIDTGAMQSSISFIIRER